LTASGLDSWYHEKESAWLYRQVAAAEPDPRKRGLFLKLAAAADQQADKWQALAAGHAPKRLYAPCAPAAWRACSAASKRARCAWCSRP
jgi:hypothetical protein